MMKIFTIALLIILISCDHPNAENHQEIRYKVVDGEVDSYMKEGRIADAQNSIAEYKVEYGDNSYYKKLVQKIVNVDSIKAAAFTRDSILSAEKTTRLVPALKFLTKTKDDIQGYAIYRDKTSPTVHWVNNVLLYVLEQAGTQTLYISLRYTSDDWLFIDHYIIKADDQTFTIVPDRSVERDNGGGDIWEWSDNVVTSETMTAIKTLLASKTVKLRCVGNQYYHDRVISSKEKIAMKHVLDAYEAMTSPG